MIYTDEERAETKYQVKVYQGKAWMSGTGFELDNATQIYKFHSQVETMHYTTIKLVR